MSVDRPTVGTKFIQPDIPAAGTAITSRQMVSLARGINGRALSGVGDMAWRHCMGVYNAWRQVRNPDSAGLLFPAQGEFFTLYQLLDPEYSQATWPEAGPGDPEGANLACPMMQFVFGLYPSLDFEDVRLEQVPLWPGGAAPATTWDVWELGKLQRGVITSNGTQNAPALAAAQDFFRIVTPAWSPHGKGYGGYQATPSVLDDDCGNGDDTDPGYRVPSLEIKFTALRSTVSTAGLHGAVTAGPVVTYSGTCPEGSADFAVGHVVGYFRVPGLTTHMVVCTSTTGPTYAVDTFHDADWIEGPYTGEPALRFSQGQQVHHALWSFISDFRGTPEQRAVDGFNIEKIAFEFQQFGIRQYYLAPAYGVAVGGGIQAVYPSGQLTASQATTGAVLVRATPHTGFCIAGAAVIATKLVGDVQISVMAGTVQVGSLTLHPDGNGDAQAVLWLPEVVASGECKLVLPSGVQFSTSVGTIRGELAELYRYKPQPWDAYLVLRLTATRGGDQYQAGVDGRGLDTTDAATLFRYYASHGCAFNPTASSVRVISDWVNDNPVYDAARRTARSLARIVDRRQFISYSVEDGDSVLRFKRYAFGLHNQRADVFTGIAPPIDAVASGALVVGEGYIVRGTGTVTHGGLTLRDGDTFTATSPDYSSGGVVSVYVKDGIREVALPRGWSNEWCCFVETKCYAPYSSSIWKPEVYADYYTWNNRCLFQAVWIPSDQLVAHIAVNYGVAYDDNDRATIGPMRVQPLIAPEAPPTYAFTERANITGSTPADFFSSCQAYEPPVKVKSCTVEIVGGQEIVVVRFSGRFRAHPDAPATWPAAGYTWSSDASQPSEVSDLYAEGYRTPDNALREYHTHTLNPHYQCSFKTGDAGYNSSISGSVFGSCYPTFFFAHLVPEPYIDSNNTLDSADSMTPSEVLGIAEHWLRFGCEGFVDRQATVDMLKCRVESANCITDYHGLFDFTWENLNYQAHGNRWSGPFPTAVRPDNMSGHGPLPNTLMYADVFGRLAKCCRLLTTARLPMSFEIWEVKQRYSQATGIHGNPDVCASAEDCNPFGSANIAYSGQGPAATSAYDTTEDLAYTLHAETAGFISDYGCYLSGNMFSLGTYRETSNWRLELVDPDALNAVPVWMRPLMATNVGLPFCVVREYWYQRKVDGDPWNCTSGATIGCEFEQITESTTTCELLTGAVYDYGPLPPSGWMYAHEDAVGINPCSGGTGRSIDATPIQDVANTDRFFVTIPTEEMAAE